MAVCGPARSAAKPAGWINPTVSPGRRRGGLRAAAGGWAAIMVPGSKAAAAASCIAVRLVNIAAA
jgi:hypothetical protein